MRDEGVIEDYAIAGAMAVLFWVEPIPTYDLDVLVCNSHSAEKEVATIGRRRPGVVARSLETLQADVLTIMAVARSRPTPELLERLRAGKRELHAEQRNLSLRERVQQLLALQKIDYEIRKARGDLREWEIPWETEP